MVKEYKVVSDQSFRATHSGLEDKLNALAQEGWRVVSQSSHIKDQSYVFVIMEREKP